MKKDTQKNKYETVIEKNTYYFYNKEHEEIFEGNISALSQNIFLLKNKIDREGLRETSILSHLLEVDDGLDALLTITGFSKESLLRLISFIRISKSEALIRLVNRKLWNSGDFDTEWGLDKIKKMIRENRHFAEGIVNIFFRGSILEPIKSVLPLFEYKKLDLNKFNFTTESLVDTLIRYKIKGSYKASKEGNPEAVIENILMTRKIAFEKGNLKNSTGQIIPRTMDFIIPNKFAPKIIIECSYLITTSSGMGDKAKTEKNVGEFIKTNYPKCLFIGFVDGIGWYIRKSDLKKMVKAYDFVFTFSEDELKRFECVLEKVFV